MASDVKLSANQKRQIETAVRDGFLLVTSAGSINDVVWADFASRGWMEPADPPAGLTGLHAWRITDAGRNALASTRSDGGGN